MRVFITGISGFVGSALTKRLTAQGEVVAGTFIGDCPVLQNVDLRRVDLLDSAKLCSVVQRWKPEVIVHLAALSHVGKSWQLIPETFQINVLGTENLLNAAAGVRTLMLSSAEVYGRVPEDEQPIGESRSVSPRSPYGLTKAAAERLALRAGGMVVRAFNMVGAGQSEDFALPNFARQLVSQKDSEAQPTLRVGNLEARRDFLHVEDGVDALCLLLEHGRAGEIYNLGSGEAVSIREALDRLIGQAGMEVAIEIDPERLREVDIELLCARCDPLRELGWSPQRTLDDALADLWTAAQTAVETEQPAPPN